MLITGISGMLGSNIACIFRDRYEVLGLYCSHPVSIEGVRTGPVDLLDPASARRVIREFAPDVVIHCASLTDVDFCQNHPEPTRRVNVQGTAAVAEALSGTGAMLIYVSSDSVYDGVKGNFSETDPVAPRNYYGQSKLEGETQALTHPNTLVLRTNIFGWNIQPKNSIGEWVLASLKAGKSINGFKDAIFSSIYTLHLAGVMAAAIEKGLTGVYNCGSGEGMSKYEFAVRLARRAGHDPSVIKPISLGEAGLLAPRGQNLSLDVSKLCAALGQPLPTLDQCIDEFCRDRDRGLPASLKRRSHGDQPLIPYGRQLIDEDDIQAVVDVLRSEWITQGPGIEDFEAALCAATGAKYAVSVSSGTAALHVACLAAGLKSGDEAIVTPMTFAASANCVLYCGAKPIFADVQSDTGNLDPALAAQAVTPRTRAIIPVHFAGHPCDMDEITALARKHNLIVIEDAAHALGATYRQTRIGPCPQSHMAILSFHPVKHITTGEGGAVVTNDPELYEKLQMYRNHGITKDHRRHSRAGEPWYYEMQELGFNYRLTNIQAALGVSQLKKLDRFLARRRQIVGIYNEAFAPLGQIQIPTQRSYVQNAWHLYVIRLRGEGDQSQRRRTLYDRLRERQIGVQVHYVPTHTHPLYRRTLGTDWGQCPIAEDYYHRCLSLPIYPAMTDSDVQRVIAQVKDVLAAL
ncbi:MAG: UDP-4-amino-4,6-dideoxy-N-acetyl-beta-L-altrosamine transaminase [Planctomycetaceae bacterium]|nr:UDP-4-amino-4,6-dideoxy-N-acetyl-beta-L-altrosamine transaminase [Planctomycetaceae bacterium]